MMKTVYKRMMVVSLVVAMSIGALAANVSLEDAQKRASAFLLSHRTAMMAPALGDASPQLLHAEVSATDPAAVDYYVFTASDKSAFVIVAGEDRAQAVLGYGDGMPDMGNLPCGMRWLLDFYKEQMQWLHSHPTAAVEGEPSLAASVKVEPLVSCTWNQGEPYNNLCPVYKNQHCITGCIATAMAQVMYYWQFPDSLPNYPAYFTSGIEVSALPGSRINWDDMLDGYYLFDGYYKMHYTEEQAQAVATLMRYCGQASRMGYGLDASGAYTWNQMTAMSDFGYNLGTHIVHRDNYSAIEWRDLLLEELCAHHPILYRGSGEAGGHAFVVDGYDGTRFHINWGWEGGGNGYFALDAFTVYGAYDFNYDQAMVADLYPGQYKPPYDVEVDGICYRRNGNELTVTRKAEWDNTYQGVVTIPAHVTIDGVECTVTAIAGSAFKNCRSLRTVVLPETMKRIGKFAFKGCTSLTAMNLPDAVEDIGFAAFQNCSAIRSFTIGKGLKHISSYAFFQCRGLQQINIPSTVETIDPEAFFYCQTLRNLTIDMECIPEWAFYCCTGLTTVTLGRHVKTISEAAFADCASLSQVNMGANLDSIASMAFYGCTAINAIRKLPENPPVVADESSFDEVNYSNATLYVPESSSVDYYCCDVWTLFEHQVVEPAALPGDVNADGVVNITDVNVVINDILQGVASADCDVNGDGSINIADVNFIIGRILSAQ